MSSTDDLYHTIMDSKKEETDYETFIKNYNDYMKTLGQSRDKIKSEVGDGKPQHRHRQAMNNLKTRANDITKKFQIVFPIQWGMRVMNHKVKKQEQKNTVEGFNALPEEWNMGNGGRKKKRRTKKMRKNSTKKTRKNSTKKMGLSASDYRKILKFYKLSIPKKVSNLRKKGDKIIAKKFCSCIKKVRKKFKKEGIAIGICTKSVITRKGIKRGSFNCKSKTSIDLYKGGSKRSTKKKTRKRRGGVPPKDPKAAAKRIREFNERMLERIKELKASNAEKKIVDTGELERFFSPITVPPEQQGGRKNMEI